ncbi:hypothetical protein TWF281_010240 [Arthrobotrys megalospora]
MIIFIMAPITRKITFRNLFHYGGKGTLSNRTQLVIDVHEDYKAFITSIAENELTEPIELFHHEVSIPGHHAWTSKKSGPLSVRGELIHFHSAKLVQENGTKFTSSTEAHDVGDNRWIGTWHATATLTFGNDGQQTFEDPPVEAYTTSE